MRHAMKSLILFLSGAAAALVCVWLAWGPAGRLSNPQKNSFSSFDAPRGPAAALQFDTGMLKLADADLEQVLNLYQEVSARTVIRGPTLPPLKISLHNQTPLTRVETLQLLDNILVQNGVTMVLVGDSSVKAVRNDQARGEVPPTIDLGADELPDSSSYMTCTVRVRHANLRDAIEVLAPMSRMQKSIVGLPSDNRIILCDYSANIRKMLQLLQQIDHPPLPWADMVKPGTNRSGKR
jgi:type II secretory pathway component GspD/PulD (secretin)